MMGRSWVAMGAMVLLMAATAQAGEPGGGIAVIIGNKGYRPGVPTVEYAHNDAEAMKRWVIDELGYRPEDVIDLRDAGKADLEATFGNLTNHQGKLFKWVRPERSEVVVFYSGHGLPGRQDGRSYLLPSDADPDNAELNGYPLELLVGNLEKLPAKSVTVFLDACFSGMTPAGPVAGGASDFGIRARPASAGGGVAVLSAASGEQIASWDREAGHGLFTAYLLRAVRGEADGTRWGNGDRKVTLGEVKAFLDDEMSYRASRILSRDQTADLSGDPARVVALVSATALQDAPAKRPGTAKRPETAAVPVPPAPKPQSQPQPQPQPAGKSFHDCADCPEMVVLPAGRFLMGSADDEPGHGIEEEPRHERVIARSFAVGRYEVTFDEWDACVEDDGCDNYWPSDGGWGRGRRPVINVSWDDAQAYVLWLSEKTGHTYRLLTEAEWEYAARGGTAAPYATGPSITPKQANFDGSPGLYREETVDVDSFAANGFGLYNMHGNVMEWVEDCWTDDYGGDAPAEKKGFNAQKTALGSCAYRVLRGGSWDDFAEDIRSASRHYDEPEYADDDVGFRVARTME